MSNFSKDTLRRASTTVRMLACDAVEEANSGHPGMPMGMAELAVALWTSHLKFNPRQPKWVGRDRFVLSNGHGSMLQYAMLHLSGYDLSLDDLKAFRQLESKTPGHPECYMTPGVETTTGPLGQGIGNAVGMAIAQKIMSARYADNEFNPVDHRVWCFVGDGCLMEGVSSEVSSLAGHLGLGNLIVVYDDNEISIAGSTDLAFTENVPQRYLAYGWEVIECDGHNLDDIDRCYRLAAQGSDKPKLIVAKTIIGKGSPNRANSYGIHGSPLGAVELELTKKNLDWPLEPRFFIPEDVSALFLERQAQIAADFAKWEEKFNAWKARDPKRAERLEQQFALALPGDLEDKLVAAAGSPTKAEATRKLSSMVLQEAAKQVPFLLGGSADLEPSTLTLIEGEGDIQRGEFSGRNLRFGVREHGMGAIMNGLSYYGGFIPYGATFLCFLDYMRPSVRLAALSHLPALYIYTHDSIFLGEDGPTHQPVEHISILRMTPNLWTFRPADALETAVCYAMALERISGPSALILSRQGCVPLTREAGFTRADIRKGAYTLQDCAGEPELVIVATGSEVGLALETASLLSEFSCRVVSMPCTEAFMAQDAATKEAIIPKSAKIAVIEAATTYGWASILGAGDDRLCAIGIDTFGASAPIKALAEHFGFTSEQVAGKLRAFLK
jgi:transketolase